MNIKNLKILTGAISLASLMLFGCNQKDVESEKAIPAIELNDILKESHPLVVNNQLLHYYDEVTQEVHLTDTFIKSDEEFNYVLDRIEKNRKRLGYYGSMVLTIYDFNFDNYNEEIKQRLNQFLIDSRNIYSIKINGLDIEDISFLSNISVINLELSNNKIEDLTVLSTIKNLETLELNCNNIIDLNPLSKLENLTELNLNNNNISDLTPLSNLYNLQYLYINDNNISDLTPLSNLFLLKFLELSNNKIITLNGIEKMYSLKGLDLSGNNVRAINAVIPLIQNNDITVAFENLSYEDYLSVMDVQNSDDNIYIRQKIKGIN